MLGAGDFKAGEQEIPTSGSRRFQRWGAGDSNTGELEIPILGSWRFQRWGAGDFNGVREFERLEDSISRKIPILNRLYSESILT